MSCSVCVMLGTATAMAAAAPRRVLLVRGVVDIVMSVASAAHAAVNACRRLQTRALLRAATAAAAAGLAEARARCDTHRCAIRSHTCAVNHGARRFSPRLRSH